MESFTIRNFFRQWKAILPLAIILTFVGLIAGVYYSNTQKQSYNVTNEVLVVNMLDTMQPDDFVAIANSEKTVGKNAKKEANVDSSCDYKASKSGNIIKITATCESNGEDSRKLAESVTNVFSRAIINIYEMDGLQTKVISEGSSEENVTTLKRISYIALPTFAGLAISAFIAFVKLDRATSEKRKK